MPGGGRREGRPEPAPAACRRRRSPALNGRGIFTVTQYSYTFRPGRLKRVAEKGGRHDHSLQALAIREKTVYVAQRPRTARRARSVLYLDVEGLPDEDFYYLIGLTVVDGETRDATLSFWADGEADEASHLGMPSWTAVGARWRTSSCSTTAATSRSSWSGWRPATAATPG